MDRLKHKETAITIMLGFLAVYFLIEFRWGIEHKWILYVIFGLGFLAMISAGFSRYLHIFWFFLAEKIGWFMSRIILGATFFLVLLPVALLSRLFRKDFMMLKKREDSYYHERNHLYTEDDFKDPW